MSKKVIEPISVITNGSMGASLTSSASTVKFMDNVSYQAVFTGSPVGSFDVQVSNDGTNWAALGLNISTANGSPQFVDVNQTGAAMIRFIYTRTSGTGTLNVIMMSKEI